MNKLVIDAASEKIFLMIITKDDIYNITKENTKINCEKLTLFVKDLLNSHNLKIHNINKIYVNQGPGSFAGIRNSLSLVKAVSVARKIDYYCYSFEDFKDEIDVKYQDIPYLCDKFKIKKNLIKPVYLS
tara:strand:+ start:70 stop:456 length:387 start_codon:yes stop_codon:yes gene_type:complete